MDRLRRRGESKQIPITIVALFSVSVVVTSTHGGASWRSGLNVGLLGIGTLRSKFDCCDHLIDLDDIFVVLIELLNGDTARCDTKNWIFFLLCGYKYLDPIIIISN